MNTGTHGDDQDRRLPVQVFGQEELVEHLRAGGEHFSHLVSIGNPSRIFQAPKPDTRIPALFHRKFERILRLDFYDVEQKRHLGRWQFPKRILQSARPAAGPHRRIVEWFDAELGSGLVAANVEIRQERLERLKVELDLSADALLEELPVADE